MSNSELAERIFFELDGLGIDNPHIQKELHAAVVILKKEIAAAELLAKMRPAPIDVEDLKAQLAAAKKLTKDYKDILDDLFDHNECLPECDSYAHHPECPQVSAIGVMRSLKKKADEARAVAIEDVCSLQRSHDRENWSSLEDEQKSIRALAKLPPGNVVVPAEPTDKMLEAAWRILLSPQGEAVKLIYKEMLVARPK